MKYPLVATREGVFAYMQMLMEVRRMSDWVLLREISQLRIPISVRTRPAEKKSPEHTRMQVI